MNGRIYDPLLGRFLSADLVVQFPGNLQSYNRYSYVQNNPVTFTDESGHLLNFVIGAVVGAVIDAGAQMVANYTSGKSLTDINLTSVAVSAAMGATGVGLGQVAAKAGATIAARVGANALAGAAEGVIETVATNAGQGKPLTEGMAMNVVTGAAAGVGGELAGEAVGKLVKKAGNTVEAGAKQMDNVAGAPGGTAANRAADATPSASRLDAQVPDTPAPSQTGNVVPNEAPAKAPERVYRGGSATDKNLTPRASDIEGLSTFNNIESATPPGGKAQVIDTSKLNALEAVPDAPPPGHVSIRPKDPSQMSGWIDARTGGVTHPLTQEIRNAIIEEEKRQK